MQTKEEKSQIAEQVYRGIFDANGHLINDAQLQIVMAALNIETEELIDRKLDSFKSNNVN